MFLKERGCALGFRLIFSITALSWYRAQSWYE